MRECCAHAVFLRRHRCLEVMRWRRQQERNGEDWARCRSPLSLAGAGLLTSDLV